MRRAVRRLRSRLNVGSAKSAVSLAAFAFVGAGFAALLDRAAHLDPGHDAAGGHFGRNEPEFTWERTDKAKELAAAAESVATAAR